MLQFSLLSLQFCSSALTDLPLCQVSPYSPPPLMFATARTPPRCRTKISLDTLKKQTDRWLLLFFNFYTLTTSAKILLLPKSMMKLWIKSLLMANLSSQAFYNGYPWKWNSQQLWERKEPLLVHSSSLSSALRRRVASGLAWQRATQDMPQFLKIIFKVISAQTRVMQYHGASTAFWTVPLSWDLRFFREESKT